MHHLLLVDIKEYVGDFVFPQNDINALLATTDLGILHLKRVKALGFDFWLYDCRHTLATRVLESGTNLLTLASMLGNANLKIVMRCAYPSESHKAEAVERMDDAKATIAKAV